MPDERTRSQEGNSEKQILISCQTDVRQSKFLAIGILSSLTDNMLNYKTQSGGSSPDCIVKQGIRFDFDDLTPIKYFIVVYLKSSLCRCRLPALPSLEDYFTVAIVKITTKMQNKIEVYFWPYSHEIIIKKQMVNINEVAVVQQIVY